MSEQRQGNRDNDPLFHGNSEERLKAILAIKVFAAVSKLESGFLNVIEQLLKDDESTPTLVVRQDLQDILEGPERFYHTFSDEIKFGSVPARLGYISTISDKTKALGYWFYLEPTDKQKTAHMIRVMDESPPIVVYDEAMELADTADKDHHRVSDVSFFLDCALNGNGARLCELSDLVELMQLLQTTELDIEKMKVV